VEPVTKQTNNSTNNQRGDKISKKKEVSKDTVTTLKQREL